VKCILGLFFGILGAARALLMWFPKVSFGVPPSPTEPAGCRALETGSRSLVSTAPPDQQRHKAVFSGRISVGTGALLRSGAP